MTTTGFDTGDLLAHSSLGVLATLKADGTPQLSPVQPHCDREAEVVLVSTTAGRAKAGNQGRDPRAALEVTSGDGRSWATAEGTVELTGPGSDPRGPEAEALVAHYRRAAGEHPDRDGYRAAVVAERRVLITLRVSRGHGESVG
ncbi:PPOX class F420-dependent oxidoreductase [Actinosynnema sp.]|uniref:PPOX class F420-dependent oxidoreductase n=1 Tax=Actinosynnema sp. TaxID=1872144 RepID=UPI003F831E0F